MSELEHRASAPAGSVGRALRAVIPSGVRHRLAANLHRWSYLPARLSPRFRESVEALARLRDRHRGETAVVIGNGPSVRSLDLSRLGSAPAFCLNRGYLLWNDQGLTPAYYVAVNDLVIEQFAADMQSLSCPVFVPWQHRARFTASHSTIFMKVLWDHAFSTDLRQGVRPGATVTMVALQLAFHMGFDKVVLLGIDHHYQGVGRPHEAVLQVGPDPNHFDPGYFGPGVRWHRPDLARSERAYRLARDTFAAAGRQIVNATPGTRLGVFPIVDLDGALRRP